MHWLSVQILMADFCESEAIFSNNNDVVSGRIVYFCGTGRFYHVRW